VIGGVALLPKAFIEYLIHFHVDRDYFECHEILEEYWKNETSQQKDSIWVGFILLAVANYHHRRYNFAGAKRTLEKAIAILYHHEKEINSLGIVTDRFFQQLDSHLIKIEKNEPYESYSLPISRSVFSKYFNHHDANKWGNRSDLNNEYLVNRHKLRDRSDVIKERKIALFNRNNKKDSD
jgi:uncharacterized protein